MSIQIALHHVTTYKYDRSINLGPQIVRLRPAPHSRTPILSYSLKVKPDNHFINWQQDAQGNYLARLVFPEKTNLFEVHVDLTADMTVVNPFDFFLEDYAQEFPFNYPAGLTKELDPYLETYEQDDIFHQFLKKIDITKKPTIDFLIAVNQQLNQEIKYLIRLEPGVQTPEETLTTKVGSCRDSAWLLVNLFRHLGLASRFVSGYLVQLKADVKSLDGPSGTEKDFTDLHAWTEVYLPGAGWVGLDPTSGLLTGEGHIPLVATPEPSSAAPISGSLEEAKTTFGHEMSVTRFHEDPRVTKPYTDRQWKDIQSVGEAVDKELNKADVKLTMGGEPTFVSVDDMEGAEWNTAALGKNKRKLSEKLFKQLKQRWTKGALIHSGQGKWYPGEQLPRWILGCYWRKDGKPIWKDESLFADETQEYSYMNKDAQKFIETLAQQLKIDSQFIIPGYEDVWYYMWKEKRLPINVDPIKSNVKDPLERARLTKIFDEQLGDVVGYTLPILNRGTLKSLKWISSPWHFSTEHMYLIPGDSPMGLRMPLDSLPWGKEEDQFKLYDQDPHQKKDDLPESSQSQSQSSSVLKKDATSKKITKGESAKNIVRTALCVEVRNGCLYIFLPPVEKIEEYLALIEAIEQTAAALKIPVVIEGYAPPYDPRVEVFKLTPDPGVIEVNVAPVASWAELVEQTTTLYEEAHQARLGAEKFMLDGKHSGTGGGNHIVLGGATPSESPFLRRPDLLASMLSYWHNHPSLSYLLSGQFIGPTSQAPRVDEGLQDSIYELEIAMEQVKKLVDKDGKCLPWVVDRLFRHLLVDGTGNTHRAEFCIDKLFSPDSSTGRLGLVELRGIEMPPHAQMSIVQQLLIRSFVATFWKNPYQEKLTRWGTTLHDRFLLPHFVAEDFKDILGDLNQAGVGLKIEHFAPQLEFRFPVIGKVNYNNIELELRSAIEPWYVLGEEPAGGSTSRGVDSSIERIQVKVKGLTGKRYVVSCNGHHIPLHRTGAEGEYVAGVRYRAWQPPACLHPTIPVHTPLIFDIIDTWTKRSIGGCTYHVAHPGGRSYDTFPVNAFEAESRRQNRFFKIGHTHGVIDHLPENESNPYYPLTLDLRRT